MENIMGNTEETTRNTEETAPVIEAKEAVIPCAVTEMETQPGTLRETTLDIPIPKILGNTDSYSTPINMNIFHQE